MPQLDERPGREGERRGEQEQDLADRRLDHREHVAEERDRPDGAPAAPALRQPREARTVPGRPARVGMPRAAGEPHERVPERAGHCVRCQEKLVVARRPWRLLSLSSGSRTPIVRMSRAPAGSEPTITAVWAEAWVDAKAPMVLLRSEKSQRFPSGLPPYTQAAGIERDGSVHSWM